MLSVGVHQSFQYHVLCNWLFLQTCTAKVERPMALNLANDDDSGSHAEVAQKDNAESNPGTAVFYFILFLLTKFL